METFVTFQNALTANRSSALPRFVYVLLASVNMSSSPLALYAPWHISTPVEQQKLATDGYRVSDIKRKDAELLRCVNVLVLLRW